jgi:prophage antirepressor-like protein
MSDPIPPTVFNRHNLSLHALLLENQPWFCARDIGRMMGVHRKRPANTPSNFQTLRGWQEGHDYPPIWQVRQVLFSDQDDQAGM